MDGGGALMNQGIHGVDLLQYLAGPVRRLTAVGTLAEEEYPGISRYSPKVRDGSE